MEKNNKKISLTEIFILIIVLVSVALILVDMTVNVYNEINLQSQSNVGDLVLSTAEFSARIRVGCCISFNQVMIDDLLSKIVSI